MTFHCFASVIFIRTFIVILLFIALLAYKITNVIRFRLYGQYTLRRFAYFSTLVSKYRNFAWNKHTTLLYIMNKRHTFAPYINLHLYLPSFVYLHVYCAYKIFLHELYFSFAIVVRHLFTSYHPC